MMIPERHRDEPQDEPPDDERADARRACRHEPRRVEHRRQDWIAELFEDEERYGPRVHREERQR